MKNSEMIHKENEKGEKYYWGNSLKPQGKGVSHVSNSKHLKRIYRIANKYTRKLVFLMLSQADRRPF